MMGRRITMIETEVVLDAIERAIRRVCRELGNQRGLAEFEIHPRSPSSAGWDVEADSEQIAQEVSLLIEQSLNGGARGRFTINVINSEASVLVAITPEGGQTLRV